MSQFFTPTRIIENTQLGKVVLLLKGLERNSNTEDEKSIFDFKYSEPLALTQENVLFSGENGRVILQSTFP